MAIIKAIKSGASIKRIIDYVTRKDGLANFMMDGIDCNPHTASYEMLYTRDKFSKYEGVQYIHMVYSLSPTESESIGIDQVIMNAKKLVEETNNFENHQVIICAHDDKKHKHAHIVVNAVNYKTGSKVRWFRTDLAAFKERVIELSLEQGLEIPEKGIGKSLGGNNQKLYKSVERGYNNVYNSWMLDMYKEIYCARSESVSKKDFIDKLESRGITTKWDNRKTILFEDGLGHKVRNSRFSEVFKIDFSKEALENGFRAAAQILGFKQENRDVKLGESKTSIGEEGFDYENYTILIKNARDEICNTRAIEDDSAAKRDNQITQRIHREACMERRNAERRKAAARMRGKRNARGTDDDFSL